MMSLDELLVLVSEVETEDPIDWAYLNIDEDTTTRLIAMSILEMYRTLEQEDPKTIEAITCATITKLVLENMVLNARLLQKEN